MGTLEELSAKIDRIERAALIGAKAVLDIKETALYTGYSVGQLYRLTSGQNIPHYKNGNKLYFKKSELEKWMCAERVRTRQEINSRAVTYIAARNSEKQNN